MNQSSRRPRKVLHVLNSAGGGAALSTLGLIDAFWKEGIAAVAVCHDAGTTAERDMIREAVHGEILFTRLHWLNKKIRSPLWKRPLMVVRDALKTGCGRRSSLQVAQFAARHEIDLIHTNTLLTPEGGLAARRLGLPHVWHLRELVGPGNPFRFHGEGAPFGRYLAAHCSKLIANSSAAAQQIRGWLPEGLLEVVPNGIDVARFAPARGPRRPDRVVVAMVGNLSGRTKKHGLFVEAAALVDRSLPVEWRIYGHDESQGGQRPADEYSRAVHTAIARHGLAERFHFPGFIADPVAIMSEVDLLVHPSEQESFGRVVVEAMAAELPVVGMRGGGVGDIIEDQKTGLLATPDNARELADCIQRLVKDAPLRRSLGLAGRRLAEDKYSQEACAAGVLRVYEQAMTRPLGRQADAPTNPRAVSQQPTVR